MDDARTAKLNDFPTFNHFFTRALKPEARPICQKTATIACPVDGAVSQIGHIKGTQVFQAKGHDYSLHALLGDDKTSSLFHDGHFATIYLSPKDYHRIHAPLQAQLKKMTYIPGKLFSVNTVTTEHVPGLFARNERVVSLFQTEAGPMAVVLVGAIFVSSIETVWAGTITPPYSKKIRHWTYENETITLKKGDELGRFNMGSTVILLFPRDKMAFDNTIKAGTNVRMGQCIGKITP